MGSELANVEWRMELGIGTPNVTVKNQLEELTPAKLFDPLPITNDALADAALAGLWIRHNFLDQGHQICQDHETDATNNFWHAILHRREGDFSNAKYWFRRVGAHPVLAQLGDQFATGQIQAPPQFANPPLFTGKALNPLAFTDLVEQSICAGSDVERFCEQIQLAEWQLLFAYSCEQATK